jgi:hypothetical protein
MVFLFSVTWLAAARKLSTVAGLVESYFADPERGSHRPNARPKRPGTMALTGTISTT